ncbi:MAG TPA: hypothetical protein VGS02_02840 [Acidobacteriaceae bacterium]|nr:hypothetical protein [Acidobacteriaceae bacterium]
MSDPAQFALPFLIEPTGAENQRRPVRKAPNQDDAGNGCRPLGPPDSTGKPAPPPRSAESADASDDSKPKPKRTVGAKGPSPDAVAFDNKVLVSRKIAAHMLSISVRAVDYMIAAKRLPTRRIANRVLIPVEAIRKFARSDHPERMAG